MKFLIRMHPWVQLSIPVFRVVLLSFLRHVYKDRFVALGHELVVPELDMIYFPPEPEPQREGIVTM